MTFKLKLTIVPFDRGNETHVNNYSLPSETYEAPGEPAHMHMLFRPGHYDVLYPKEEALGS